MTDEELEKLILNRAPLFAPEPEGDFGSYRESLVSYLRAVCAANFLSSARVIDQVIRSRLKSYCNPGHHNYPVYALNHGGQITQEFTKILEDLTGKALLERLSLNAWNVSDLAKPLIAIEREKKWCPACYQTMVREDRRLHDPLIWSVKGVEICPLHSTFLERRCPHCGKESFAMLVGTDVAGFCPSCQWWLGSNGREIGTTSDETFKYYDWVAKAVLHLLKEDPAPQTDFHKNLSQMIDRLIDWHFDGNISAAARAIGRHKSQLCEWRTGRISPRWESICQISFVFQVPLKDFFLADTDSVAASVIRPLPLSLEHSQHFPKVRKEHDWNQVSNYMDEVKRGLHNGILYLAHVANRWGIDRTFLGRKLPEECAALEAILVKRRTDAKNMTVEVRRVALTLNVKRAVEVLDAAKIKLTRRSLTQELVKLGMDVRRTESQAALTLARSIKDSSPGSVGSWAGAR